MSDKPRSIFEGKEEDEAFPFAQGRCPSPAKEGDRISERDVSSVMNFEGESGFGSMRFVEALPGIMVSFNEFRMAGYLSAFATSRDVLCVDWCKEGRIEQPMPNGSYAYVSSGDLKIDDRSCHAGRFVFPTSHYCGITVSFDLAKAPGSIRRALPGFSIDLHDVKRRLCLDGHPLMLRDCRRMGHIAGELYDAPARARRAYCQIKALEVLLFLDSLDPAFEGKGLPYFPRSRVARVKAARDLMVSDLSAGITVEKAAQSANMSLTAFKECFKGIYGASPAAYVRSMRMDMAAKMLRGTDMRVVEIATSVGYDSPSKFSAAFKAATGLAPSEYRQRR